MESRKVRRPLRERRPEHFYQDFLKKLMIFCPAKVACVQFVVVFTKKQTGRENVLRLKTRRKKTTY